MTIIGIEALLPIASFIFVSTITPGPNNIMLATSGMRFGMRATLPHIIGIHCGLYLLVLLAAVGINQILLSMPEVLLFLRIFGSLYLAYLAWKILGFTLKTGSDADVKPLGILQALGFQFANPKAWIMSTSAMALALPLTGSALSAALALCLTWASLGFLCNCCWVLTGSNFRQYLENPTARRWISGCLALLTVATIGMFWAG